MKKLVWLVAVLAVSASVIGCAQKTASEKLRDDMNKAGKQMEKDTKTLFK